jgi:L-arabinokinase
MSNGAIAYYVSAHGYGHGVRSCDIIGAINRLCPRLSITVVSDLPVSFFENRLGSGTNLYRSGAFDVGMVQLDSIRTDVPATLAKVEALYAQSDKLIAEEIAFLERACIGLVVADIPAIPLEAAALAGIPRIAVGNFSWDWIYSAFVERDARWRKLVRRFENGYGKADLLLRLPFSADMHSFRAAEDIPLVASPGQNRRAELATIAGCREDKRWVLLSFTTLDWGDDALDNVEKLTEYEFFTVLPLRFLRGNIHPIKREQVPFADVAASVDGVLSKPGYGIVSDCVVNQKPLLYAERTDFAEYEVLVEAIRKYLKHSHIPAERLYRGEIGPALDLLWDCPDPPLSLQGGGAEIAAHRIEAFLL